MFIKEQVNKVGWWEAEVRSEICGIFVGKVHILPFSSSKLKSNYD